MDELDNCPQASNSDQQDSDLNGIGDACQTPGLRHSTAAFLQAGFDGSTTVEPRSLPVAEEPPLSEKIERIVEFRITEGLTDNPAALAANLIASQGVLGLVKPVGIAVKPGEIPNPINPRSRDVIPVAILTTDAFDATTVDPLSVQFGPGGATEAHRRGHIEDVDGDGDNDLVLHFNTQNTGIVCGDAVAFLTGQIRQTAPARAWCQALKAEGREVWFCRTLPDNPIRVVALP